MDSAELYLLILRPTLVPVVGEAVANGFQGQVEIATWNWNLQSQDAAFGDGGGDSDGESSAGSSLTAAMGAAQTEADRRANERTRALVEMTRRDRWDALDPRTRERKLRDYFRGLAREEVQQAREDAADEADTDAAAGGAPAATTPAEAEAARQRNNYSFTFSKRVDVSTTQLLNSMKVGDVLPAVTMTVHQRSSNSGLTLVFVITNVRLTKYSLKVEMTDTMTDLLEDWEATFESMTYTYTNRKIIDKTENVGQEVAKSLSQGTVRTFAMKNFLA